VSVTVHLIAQVTLLQKLQCHILNMYCIFIAFISRFCELTIFSINRLTTLSLLRWLPVKITPHSVSTYDL